jgi:hypothetical protein
MMRVMVIGDDVMIFLFFSWDGTTSKRDVSE